jgi:hypothetical protein
MKKKMMGEEIATPEFVRACNRVGGEDSIAEGIQNLSTFVKVTHEESKVAPFLKLALLRNGLSIDSTEELLVKYSHPTQ